MSRIWYPVYSTSEPEDEYASHKAAFIGVSTKALQLFSKTDRNNVVLTSETGHELGLQQTKPVYFEGYSGGFCKRIV